ncbi:MAG TPA: hypothetical protein VJ697_14025 [Nitrososphaeraceae archaeon]|nr:hypothetical protein [Nitrososphaeraceae archaeon]
MGVSRNSNSLGNITTLRSIITPISLNSKVKKPKVPKDRIIRVSEHLYMRLKGFSSRNYNVESYENIISDLLDSYEKDNPAYPQYTRY